MMIGVQTADVVTRDACQKGFQLIGDAGFDCVDLSMFTYYPYAAVTGGVKASIFDEPIKNIIQEFSPYKEGAKGAGLLIHQAHGPFPSYVPNQEVTQAVDKAIRKCIQVCDWLDCRLLVVHPYFDAYPRRMDAKTQWQQNQAFYEGLIPACSKYEVGICLENMFTDYRGRIYSSACSNLDEALFYIDQLNTAAGFACFSFCYDTGHQTVLGQDMRAGLGKLGKRVRALHVHDNDGRMDQHMGPYMGVSDWDAFVEGLRDIAYEGAICFETSAMMRRFPKEVWPEALSLLAATGRMFSNRIKAV